MLGYFPAPYPDELLYSVCGRFVDRMHYTNSRAISRDLFGNGLMRVAVYLPGNLSNLVANLPLGYPYTVDDLLDKHTLFPLYEPFLPSDKTERLREDIRSGNVKGRLCHQVGAISTSYTLKDWLDFCPLCVQDDRQQLGECYWHRVHQVPGVRVCAVHQVWLEQSAARGRYWQSVSKVVSAENSVHAIPPRPLDLQDSRHQILLDIARGAEWLLAQRGLSTGVESIRQKYFTALKNRGLEVPFKKIEIHRFTQELRSFYPLDFLIELGGGTDEHTSIVRFIISLTRDSLPKQPLRHLLLVRFLGYTMEEYFRLPVKQQSAGEESGAYLGSYDLEAKDRFGRIRWDGYAIEMKNAEQVEDILPGGRGSILGPNGVVHPHWGRGMDWEKLDVQLAEAIRDASTRLRSMPGRPVRVTKNAIWGELGMDNLHRTRLKKLRMTMSAFAEEIETEESWTLRRVEWATECYLQERVYPSRWQLISRAGLERRAKKPYVVEAIDVALQTLAEQIQASTTPPGSLCKRDDP
jgi:hypothetical protein